MYRNTLQRRWCSSPITLTLIFRIQFLINGSTLKANSKTVLMILRDVELIDILLYRINSTQVPCRVAYDYYFHYYYRGELPLHCIVFRSVSTWRHCCVYVKHVYYKYNWRIECIVDVTYFSDAQVALRLKNSISRCLWLDLKVKKVWKVFWTEIKLIQK